MTPLEQFGQIIADAQRKQDRRTVAEAAKAAHCAGGPSIPELERLIAAQRAERAA